MISDVAIYRRVDSNLSTYPLVTGGGINAGLYGSAQVRLGGGTSGSNPLCSSGESAANLTSIRAGWADSRGLSSSGESANSRSQRGDARAHGGRGSIWTAYIIGRRRGVFDGELDRLGGIAPRQLRRQCRREVDPPP
jgi:hypothetical protein